MVSGTENNFTRSMKTDAQGRFEVNTDPSFNTFVISLPPDAIREFQIQTGTYTAELGSGTGQINDVYLAVGIRVSVGPATACRSASRDLP
jgi:hypothetical protein